MLHHTELGRSLYEWHTGETSALYRLGMLVFQGHIKNIASELIWQAKKELAEQKHREGILQLIMELSEWWSLERQNTDEYFMMSNALTFCSNRYVPALYAFAANGTITTELFTEIDSILKEFSEKLVVQAALQYSTPINTLKQIRQWCADHYEGE